MSKSWPWVREIGGDDEAGGFAMAGEFDVVGVLGSRISTMPS
jgi:hypothetical protein